MIKGQENFRLDISLPRMTFRTWKISVPDAFFKLFFLTYFGIRTENKQNQKKIRHY